MTEQPYNPLARINLGKSVAEALLMRDVMPMPPANRRNRAAQLTGLPRFSGAGIYVIYYIGNFPLYASIAEQNRNDTKPFSAPIYVGKADPKGSRTGIYDASESLKGEPLYERLVEHARSIEQARNLSLEHFRCRYLLVEDIWIPLGESLLINEFKPVWNKFAGFGIHQPGGGREKQRRSIWDTLHPGRSWAAKLPPNDLTLEQIEANITAYLRGDTSIPDIEPES